MSGQFVSDRECRSMTEVQALYPGWKVVRIRSGWMAFEFIEDFLEWRDGK